MADSGPVDGDGVNTAAEQGNGGTHKRVPRNPNRQPCEAIAAAATASPFLGLEYAKEGACNGNSCYRLAR